jgi:ATP-dependent Clp protease adapter protein ClpS
MGTPSRSDVILMNDLYDLSSYHPQVIKKKSLKKV